VALLVDLCVAFFVLIVSSFSGSRMSYLSGCAVHPLKTLMEGGFSTPF